MTRNRHAAIFVSDAALRPRSPAWRWGLLHLVLAMLPVPLIAVFVAFSGLFASWSVAPLLVLGIVLLGHVAAILAIDRLHRRRPFSHRWAVAAWYGGIGFIDGLLPMLLLAFFYSSPWMMDVEAVLLPPGAVHARELTTAVIRAVSKVHAIVVALMLAPGTIPYPWLAFQRRH